MIKTKNNGRKDMSIFTNIIILSIAILLLIMIFRLINIFSHTKNNVRTKDSSSIKFGF